MHLLAPLAEACLHDPIEGLARGACCNGRCIAAPEAKHGGIDGRGGLEGGRGDARHDLRRGDVLGEDRQVAHLSRRRRDALGDLELNEQDRQLRWPLALEEGVEQRAGDVVRDVRHDLDRLA